MSPIERQRGSTSVIHPSRCVVKTNLHSRKATGLVAGAYGEMTRAVSGMADFTASGLAAEQLQFFDIDPEIRKSIFLQQIRRCLGLAVHHERAKLKLDRYRDPVQHLNQQRPTAADATDADDEEACAFYHHNHPPGCAG